MLRVICVSAVLCVLVPGPSVFVQAPCVEHLPVEPQDAFRLGPLDSLSIVQTIPNLTRCPEAPVTWCLSV